VGVASSPARARLLRRFDDGTTAINLSTAAFAPHPLVGGFVEVLPFLAEVKAIGGEIFGCGAFTDSSCGWFGVAFEGSLVVISAIVSILAGVQVENTN
jgi:hypothetical protein